MRARTRTGLAHEFAGRRAGFTLVEVMVVIGIIAVLASLLLGAVQRARVFGQRTTAGSDIAQMDTACAKFKVDFGFNPPQKLVLPRHGMQASWSVNEQKAAQLLTKMFRGYDPTNSATPALTFRGTTPPNDPVEGIPTLTGIQSLAFFLGGPNLTGFKPTAPYAALPDDNSKKGPYFVFDANRFRDEDKNDSLDYRDPWKTPYAYFSSGTAGGDKYDAGYTWQIPGRPVGTVLGAFRVGGSGALTGTGPSPWANPGGVQIISAGPDGVFGQTYVAPSAMSAGGNLWIPKQGEYADNAVLSGVSGNGADDISNFNGGAPLGVAGN